MTYEALKPQCGRSVVQVLIVRVDIGVVIYEAMTPQCGRPVVQVLCNGDKITVYILKYFKIPFRVKFYLEYIIHRSRKIIFSFIQ